MIVTENQKYVGAFMSHSAFDQLLITLPTAKTAKPALWLLGV